MQAQTVNAALVEWLDQKIEGIEQAADGRQRWARFNGAVSQLNCGQGMAPIRSWAAEDYFGSEYDRDELVMCLQTLCWCALAEGVKPDTVKRVFDAEIERINECLK
jgi:hypothetical protein